MTIIISKDGKNAEMLKSTGFQNEDYLQEYIQNNPETIPLYELKEDRKLFIAKREFSTNAGPLDALAIDDIGDIYIIETKLYKNPDKRLVVAQALDYGAAIWKNLVDFNDFIEVLSQETIRLFNLAFQDKVREFFELDDEQTELVLSAMQKNLNDGNIKFVILMDKIERRLKDLIHYVNQNSRFDIYAVQFEYYKHEKYEIIIPKTFGVDIKKDIKQYNASSRINWNREGFEKEIESLDNETKRKITNLLEFTQKEQCLEGWGTGRIPTFHFKLPHPFRSGKKVTVFNVWSDGYIQVGYWLQHIKRKDPDKVNAFFEMLNDIKEINVVENQTRTDRWPLSVINNDNIEKIKEATLWLKNHFQKII